MLRLAAVALLVATFIGAANGQTGRVEILPFTSKTLTDSAFLSGAKTGQDVTIAGELRLPKAQVSRRHSSTRVWWTGRRRFANR